MGKESAGLLMYRFRDKRLQVFLVHPGGPFWKGKDDGAWGIPKGEVDDKEEHLDCAVREFKEEIGIDVSGRERFVYLGEIKQKGGKKVCAWAFEGDWTGLLMMQSYVEIEWPYKSGKKIKIPEIDKAGFFDVEDARRRINNAQKEFIERLVKILEEANSVHRDKPV